jgi:hypothetical protein
MLSVSLSPSRKSCDTTLLCSCGVKSSSQPGQCCHYPPGQQHLCSEDLCASTRHATRFRATPRPQQDEVDPTVRRIPAFRNEPGAIPPPPSPPRPRCPARAPQAYDYRDEDAPMGSTAMALADHFGIAPGAASVTNGGIPSGTDEGTEMHGADPTRDVTCAYGEAAIVENPWDGYDAPRSDPPVVRNRHDGIWICPMHGPTCSPKICKEFGLLERNERWKKEQEERDERRRKRQEKKERRAQRKAQEGDNGSSDEGVILFPAAEQIPLTLTHQVHPQKLKALAPTHLSRQLPHPRHPRIRRPARW